LLNKHPVSQGPRYLSGSRLGRLLWLSIRQPYN